LKVKCDVPLSNFAFNFNLRRYTVGVTMFGIFMCWNFALTGQYATAFSHLVRRCRLTLLYQTHVESAWK